MYPYHGNTIHTPRTRQAERVSSYGSGGLSLEPGGPSGLYYWGSGASGTYIEEPVVNFGYYDYYTFTFWFYVDINAGVWSDVFTIDDGTKSRLELAESNQLYWFSDDGNNSKFFNSGTYVTTIQRGKWYYFAMSVNETTSTAEIYINGELCVRNTAARFPYCPDVYFLNRVNSANMKGGIADVTLYSGHNLTQEEIKKSMKFCICNIKFDDKYFYDYSQYGNNGWVVSANPPQISKTGQKIGEGCGIFNGNNVLALPKTCKPQTGIMVNIWAYMDNWSEYSTANMRLASCTETGGWNFEPAGNYMQWSVYIEGLGYRTLTSKKQLSQFTPGWHMFTGMWSNGISSFYIDGELQSTTNTGGTLIGYNWNNCVFIGAEAGSSDYLPDTTSASMFKGKINNLQIWGGTNFDESDVIDLWNRQYFRINKPIKNYGQTVTYIDAPAYNPGNVIRVPNMMRRGLNTTTLTGTTSTVEVCATSQETLFVNPKSIYYARVVCSNTISSGASVDIYWPIAEPSTGSIAITTTGSRNYNFYFGRTQFSPGLYNLRVDNNNNYKANTMKISRVILIDLTGIFGPGNEPSKEWCDSHVETGSGSFVTIKLDNEVQLENNGTFHSYTHYGGGSSCYLSAGKQLNVAIPPDLERYHINMTWSESAVDAQNYNNTFRYIFDASQRPAEDCILGMIITSLPVSVDINDCPVDWMIQNKVGDFYHTYFGVFETEYMFYGKNKGRGSDYNNMFFLDCEYPGLTTSHMKASAYIFCRLYNT